MPQIPILRIPAPGGAIVQWGAWGVAEATIDSWHAWMNKI